jgi:pimeloyl-ACP methyl ester carboxylesterase
MNAPRYKCNFKIPFTLLLLILCGTAVCRGTQASEQGIAEVNGTKLFYEILGKGPTVVLIHGGLGDSRLWDDQIKRLAKHHKVLRYDLRSFGKSTSATAPFSHIEDLRALLDFLHINKATLVGLSLGGMIAADFALEYPARVERLVLVDAGLRGDKQPPPRDAKEAYEAIRRGAEPFADVAMRSDFYRAVKPNSAIYKRLRGMVIDNYRSLASPSLSRYPETPTIDRLGSISAQTLVVIGDQDDQRLKNISDMLAAKIPSARLVTIQGSSHHPPVEKPKAFNKVVLEFIDAH